MPNESDPKVLIALGTRILEFVETIEASPLEKVAALSIAKVAIEEANNAQFAAVLRSNMNNSTRGKR